jgi:hypothetical protein
MVTSTLKCEVLAYYLSAVISQTDATLPVNLARSNSLGYLSLLSLLSCFFCLELLLEILDDILDCPILQHKLLMVTLDLGRLATWDISIDEGKDLVLGS